MARRPSKELQELLAIRDADVADLARAARRAVLGIAPDSWELIYETYAVSIGFSCTEALRDAFCHVAVYSKHVNLGFNRGAELEDPEGLLRGKGKLIRHVRLTSKADLKRPELLALVEDAVAHALGQLGSRSPTKGKAVLKSKRDR